MSNMVQTIAEITTVLIKVTYLVKKNFSEEKNSSPYLRERWEEVAGTEMVGNEAKVYSCRKI